MLGVPKDSSTSISAPPFHLLPAVQIANQYAAAATGMRARVSHRRSLPSSWPPLESAHFAVMLPLPALCADTLTFDCDADSGRTYAFMVSAVNSRYGRAGSSTGCPLMAVAWFGATVTAP